jgi:thioesterase domain-containing protein
MTPGDPLAADPSSLAASLQDVMHASVPVLRVMGAEVLEAEPGRVRTRLPFIPGNGNHIGTVYAGVLFSFLESSGGALVAVGFDVSRWIPVIVEGTIRYLRPVTGAVETELTIGEAERHAVHAALDADPKHRWILRAAAVADDGRVACEADFAYRFRSMGRTEKARNAPE